MLLSFVWDLLLFVLVLRLWMQYFNAPFSNPVSQLVIRVTLPFVWPLQRILPRAWGFDLAIIAAFLVISMLKSGVVMRLTGSSWPNVHGVFLLSMADFIHKNFIFFSNLVFIRAIVSWFSPSPGAPMMQILLLITEPLLKWARGYIPPLANTLDLSPLVVFIVLQALDYLLVGPIVSMGMRWV